MIGLLTRKEARIPGPTPTSHHYWAQMKLPVQEFVGRLVRSALIRICSSLHVERSTIRRINIYR